MELYKSVWGAMMRKILKKIFPIICFRLDKLMRVKKYNRYKNSSLEEKREILKIEYYINMGKELQIDNPKRYTEKIQWLKLYGVDQRMSNLSDKFAVREWIKSTIGEDYLLPLITIVNAYEEIKFDKLPNQFVIKSNNSSGWNIIVKNKKKINHKLIRTKMDYWKNTNYAYYSTFEMQYETIMPVFLIEELINDSNGELNDYKFLCFDGNPVYCWVDTGRFSEHKRTFFDMNWEKQEWGQTYPLEDSIEKPKNFEKMITLARKLSYGFKQVRVDLYNVDGKIYFGEMTFTNGNGFEKFIPDKYDEILGEMWTL